MNQTTIYKITQMQEQVSQLEQKPESQTQIFLEAAQQAREGGVANTLNLNLMGFWDIPRVLEEATKAFGSHG
ncbi:uncharacterized protein B0P05DRAFT_590733 [Gilbertella persicaria]|uniref:uncharacterized protein n=1 Tax=Gilbertella persicaria TaxID=101096 RepID=UPI002220A1D8|nr:uncharacterized protein B0P05DRAFT_590733 [Gilbertella persicaria]KAI8060621.1 hypothetical protein B0P05DRAFT_590733 [Gilbertella persicaria]